jgi:phasin family protein
MHNATQQFSSINKANLQAFTHLANTAFSGVEKLVELNLASSKAVLGESFGHIRAALEVKDAAQLQAVSKDFMQTSADHSSAYAQQIQAIMTSTSAELSKALEAQTAQAQKSIAGVMDGLVKNAPAGTEAAVAAFQKAMTAGQTAIESAQTQAQKAVEAARTTFTETTQQSVDAVKKAAKAN